MSERSDFEYFGCKRFVGKVAIVTGAGQGIGRATALRLGGEGATVVIADRAEGPACQVLGELQEHGVPSKVIVADLGSYEEARRVMSETKAAFGRIDVLVNCVGGTIRIQPYWSYTEEQILAEAERTFWPTMWCCRAVLDHMLEQESGVIVNVGSNSPRGIYRVPYAASKGGVFSLTTSLSLEVATRGIRVNCVAPGATHIAHRPTPRNPVAGAPTPQEEQWREELNEFFDHQLPMRRWGTPEEQAAAIAFMASDDASFITGQILSVAGGATVP